MQVFILQYFTRMVKNLKKRENTENLCLIIRGSQDHALQGPQKPDIIQDVGLYYLYR